MDNDDCAGTIEYYVVHINWTLLNPAESYSMNYSINLNCCEKQCYYRGYNSTVFRKITVV